jgi:hypothetical protein
MARRAWYRSSEYSDPFEAKGLGDGSVVEVVAEGDQRVLTRVYPNNFTQEVVFQLLPSGERKYLRIDDGPEHPNPKKAAEREAAFNEHLANGEVRITARGAVPGQGISDTYDRATKKDYATSDQFEQEYARMKLAKTMQSDRSTDHDGTGKAKKVDTSGVNIQSFNVRAEGSRDVPTGV